MRYKRGALNLLAGYDAIDVSAEGISFIRRNKTDRYAWSDIESIHDRHNEQRNYRYPGLPSWVTQTLTIKTRSGRTYRILHFGFLPDIQNTESFLPEIERYYTDVTYSDNSPLLDYVSFIAYFVLASLVLFLIFYISYKPQTG